VLFPVFTGRFGDFKPPGRNLPGAPVAETVPEPRAGGGITDRAADGPQGWPLYLDRYAALVKESS
jgi:hypothetical protein